MATSIQIQTDLAYEWLASNGVDFEGSCALMHDGPCYMDILRMAKDVAKVGMKYYVSFHLIPLALRLRKCKDREQVLELLGKSGLEYIKSILFMVFLVTGVKVGLCGTSQNRIPFLETAIIGTGFVSALAIFFEERSRRKEIGYFVMAKALRSTYKSLSRKGIVTIKNQYLVMHVMLMSLLYYVYIHHPSLLKFRNLFEMVLGE